MFSCAVNAAVLVHEFPYEQLELLLFLLLALNQVQETEFA